MGISYAEVLIALVLTLLAGLLLLGASGDAQTIHTYVKERNVASSIMYEQLYNAPWYSETATSSWFTVVTWTTALLEACRWAVPVLVLQHSKFLIVKVTSKKLR